MIQILDFLGPYYNLTYVAYIARRFKRLVPRKDIIIQYFKIYYYIVSIESALSNDSKVITFFFIDND